MFNLLKNLLAEFKANLDFMRGTLYRRCQFAQVPNKIKVAIGMRRVGKTYFIFQTIRNLMAEHNILWHQILYINFEDDRLWPCTQAQLRDLLEGFYQLYPDNHNNTCYLFLDEIQNVEDWALVIRRFFDTKKVQIYLTGSSARLLSKEIATSLRGRSISTEIWPYDFKEYLVAQHVQITEDIFGQQTRDILCDKLRQYLLQGGFPETMNVSADKNRQILQDYVDVVLMRDIIERYSITNISLVKYLINTLIKNIGSGFSVHKFANDVKSQGLIGAKNTIYDYLSYIEDAYLAFAVSLFSESIRKVHSNPRKIYAIDPGLVNAFSFSLNDNYGHLFENLIYLDLRRKGHKIHYYLTQERYEVDFLTEDPLGQRHLYQVVWDASNANVLNRELRALKAAEHELGLTGTLITPESYIEILWNEQHQL